MKVSIDDLSNAIMGELTNYAEGVTEELKNDVRETADECVKMLKKNSPEYTGDYRKGWKLATVHESKNDIRVRIHNPKEYRLTHLLENGHATRDGGRVEGTPHIAPTEKYAEEKLMAKVKVGLK